MEADIENKILNLLDSNKDKYYTPIQIATAIGLSGEKKRSSTINPHLYALEKKNLVYKVAEENGRNPRWGSCKT